VTREEKDKIVLAFLSEHPCSDVNEIANGTGLTPAEAKSAVKHLMAALSRVEECAEAGKYRLPVHRQPPQPSAPHPKRSRT
jgi:DNA-binding IclR family transcriptional regulator